MRKKNIYIMRCIAALLQGRRGREQRLLCDQSLPYAQEGRCCVKNEFLNVTWLPHARLAFAPFSTSTVQYMLSARRLSFTTEAYVDVHGRWMFSFLLQWLRKVCIFQDLS